MLLHLAGPWITSTTKNVFYLLEELVVLTDLIVSSNAAQQILVGANQFFLTSVAYRSLNIEIFFFQ